MISWNRIVLIATVFTSLWHNEVRNAFFFLVLTGPSQKRLHWVGGAWSAQQKGGWQKRVDSWYIQIPSLKQFDTTPSDLGAYFGFSSSLALEFEQLQTYVMYLRSTQTFWVQLNPIERVFVRKVEDLVELRIIFISQQILIKRWKPHYTNFS